MWDLYKKTFLRMQFMMWLAAWAAAKATHEPSVGLAFLVTMQVGSLLGATLAARFKGLPPFRAGAPKSKGVEGEAGWWGSPRRHG